MLLCIRTLVTQSRIVSVIRINRPSLALSRGGRNKAPHDQSCGAQVRAVQAFKPLKVSLAMSWVPTKCRSGWAPHDPKLRCVFGERGKAGEEGGRQCEWLDCLGRLVGGVGEGSIRGGHLI